MKCKLCDTEIQTEWRFCPECGVFQNASPSLFEAEIDDKDIDQIFNKIKSSPSSVNKKSSENTNLHPLSKQERENVLEVIVRQALSFPEWRLFCEAPMKQNDITEEEVLLEVNRRLEGQRNGADLEKRNNLKTATVKSTSAKPSLLPENGFTARQSASTGKSSFELHFENVYNDLTNIRAVLTSLAEKQDLGTTEIQSLLQKLVKDLEKSIASVRALESAGKNKKDTLQSDLDREYERVKRIMNSSIDK